MLRESLDHWFDANKIRPVVLGEFEDRELLKTFGASGRAAFPAAAAIEAETRAHYGAERVGWVRGVREVYYAIAVERRVIHPVVQRLVAQATRNLRSNERATRDTWPCGRRPPAPTENGSRRGRA